MAIRGWALAPGLTGALFGIAASMHPATAWAACSLQDLDPIGRIGVASAPGLHSAAMPWSLLTDTFCWHPPGGSLGPGPAAPSRASLAASRTSPAPREIVHRGVTRVTQTTSDGRAAVATGLRGTGWPERIVNEGTLDVRATATLSSASASLTLAGGSEAADTTTLGARAVGMEGGQGDALVNSGVVSARATASIGRFAAEMNLIDLSHGDTSLKVGADAIGIDAAGGSSHGKNAGLGATSLLNSGGVTAISNASAGSVGVELNAIDAATGDSRVAIEAGATGLRGGRATTRIDNPGSIQASATARLSDVSVTASFLDATVVDGQDEASLPSTVSAGATGIDASRSERGVTVSHAGTLRAGASASAHSTQVSVSSEGLPDTRWSLPLSQGPAEFGVEALSRTIGIVSGRGDDRMTISGGIAASASANATQESVNVGIAVFDLKLPTLAHDLNNAGTSASASVTGVDSGAGHDTLVASGTLNANATAKASATTVAVDIAELSLDVLPGVPSLPFGVSLVVTDTATAATAKSTGITTGSGNDSLLHQGTLRSTAGASSGSASAAASLNMAYGKGDNTLAIDVIAARAVTEAQADAVGLDGGSGRDLLRHEGSATVAANADALAVAAILDVAGTLKGKGGAVSGALTDSSARGTATAIGLQGGDGDDTLGGSGSLDVGAKADVNAVSVSTTIGIVQQGLVAGATLSRSASTATASATGLDGGAGSDLVVRSGSTKVNAEAEADAVSVSVTLSGTAKGIEGGAALADAHTTASAMAVGIRSGSEAAAPAHGHDAHKAQNNGGCAPCTPPATVTHGGTMVVNAQADADAVGVGAKLGVAKTGVALGAALARSGSTSTGSAIGIQGDGHGESIVNSGSIGLRSVADGDAVSVALTVEGTATGLAAGAALADASVVATAGATGIAGGGGDDRITHSGVIATSTVAASATAVSVAPSVLIAKQGAALGASLADTRTTATANLRGLDGGDGRDGLSNEGRITLQDGSAQADAVSVSLQVALAKEGLAAGAALARSDSHAVLAAAGLDGGSGDDLLFNKGSVTLQRLGTNADAVGVAATLSGAKDGVALGASLASATGQADTAVRAIDAGSGNDQVLNSGSLLASGIAAEAGAAGISVTLAGVSAGVAAGVTLADTSATARAAATGVHGSDGHDALWNEGRITLSQVTADADAVSVGVSLTTAVSGGVAGGAALGRARSEASARATAIDGGAGNDQLSNRGRIIVEGVDADTDAVGVSAQLGVTNNGVALGAALVDTAATALADARGLDGGSGDDRLFNRGTVTLRNLRAQADAVSVGVTLNAAVSAGVAAGVALTDGSGTATLQARGLAGGDGNDLIVQTGRVRIENAQADAQATGVSVTLNASMAGLAAGAAIADTRATARTEVTGLSGDAGNDTLHNAGSVDVSGRAHTGALSLALQISGAVGVAGGATITDASSNATSTVIGIDGGAGRDTLLNEGAVKASSVAASESAAISLGVSVGVGGDVTLADARSTTTARAVGLHDSAGAPSPGCGHAALGAQSGCSRHASTGHDQPADSIDNRAAVTADAVATARGTSVAGNLRGFALGETTNSASADAAGIRSHDSRDLIRNAGTITSTSSASTEGLSVAVTLAGKSFGDASSTAAASGVGIDSGAGDDQIANLAAIGVDARSQARATSVSVGLVGVAQADASTTAQATARGIDAGAGDDSLLNLGGVTANAGLPRLRQGDGLCTTAAGGACASASTVSVTLAGYGDANAGSAALAAAVGLDGGSGRDRLDNRAAVTVGALARGRAVGTSVAVLGAASADAGSSARAQAIGIDAGRDNDRLVNSAAVRSEAAAESLTRGMAFTVAGSSSSAGSSTTAASALGLGGGDGHDAIGNADSGRVTVRANTEASVSASAWNFIGAAAARATLGSQADATGIDGGAGIDRLFNAGIVDVATGSLLTAGGQATAIFGGAAAGSKISAATTAVGIAGGDDADTLMNLGQTTATARARMSARTVSASFAGSAATTEFVSAVANATALDAGAGNDTVSNDGSAVAEVSALARTEGSSSTDLAGDAQASGTVAASATARGIDGGSGRTWLSNGGSVGAIVSAQSWATHSSDSGVFFSDAGVVASSSARLSGAGIVLGDGGHAVRNTGSIAVAASTGAGDWNGNGQAEGTFARAQADGGDFDIFTGDGDAAGTATVRTDVALDGIRLGSGPSHVRNDGRISVRSGADGLRATAEVVSNGGAVTVDGDAAGWAHATMTSTARGIAASGGGTGITNQGSIALNVSPVAAGLVDAEGGSSGDTDVFVDARVDSRAVGIALGAGRHGVLNTGTVGVRHAAAASAVGLADGEGIDGDGRVGFGIALSLEPGLARVNAVTTGIDVGGSEAWIAQRGRVVLDDAARAASTAHADSDFTGDANAFARGEVATSLHGLRIRGEQAVIANTGTISLNATPVGDSLASGRASGDGSRAWGTAYALSQVDARLRGIGSEGARSEVLNTGEVVLTATLGTTARGEAESNLDAHSRANASASGTVRGTGIEASGSGAVVDQRGSVDVRVSGSARATTWSSADGALARTRAIAESVASLESQAIGLRVADAGGALTQSGLVTVSSRASTSTVTDTDAPGLPKGVENNYSLASASAYGLSVGSSRARLSIDNSGTIRVAATGTAQAAAEGSTYMHTEELATARATGIAGGSAADTTVRNGGRIVATATASSDWNDLGQAPVAEAVGIRTGSGNDTVLQAGSILTTQRTPGAEARGTAITTGAGNDRVVLAEGSVTEGRIDLGTGHDTLVLQGTPVVRGSIGGGRALSASTPGSLTLQLLGNGRFAGELPGNIAIKLGAGTYSLATLRTLDRLEVHEGTLALDSGYTMASGSRFVATVRGDGSHGQLHVRGQASLAGSMTVLRGDDAFVDGTQYDVLKADGGLRAGTAFSSIELPAPTPLLSFGAQQLRDRVRITADVQSFTSVAKNAGQRAIAQQLDRVVPLSSGELRRTLGAMQRLNSDAEFGTAFDSLDPSVHARHSQASLSGPRKHARTLHDRMTALRIGALAVPEDAPSRRAWTGDAGASGQGLWKTSFTLQGGQGERHDVDGLALGFDRRIGENLTAGVSFAHAANQVLPDPVRPGLERDQSHVRSGLAAVYGGYFDRRWHLSGTLATGRNDYESRRSIVVGTVASPASSSHRGTVTATSLEAGYLLPTGHGWLDPYLHLQHTQVAERGFSESGSGAAGLVIAARRTRELLSTLGVRWSQIFERGNGAFVTPEVGIGWLHDFSRTPSVQAAFVGAPTAGFTIEGAPVQREGAVLGLGLNYRTTRGITGSIRYSGELRRGEATHGVIGEFRVEF